MRFDAFSASSKRLSGKAIGSAKHAGRQENRREMHMKKPEAFSQTASGLNTRRLPDSGSGSLYEQATRALDNRARNSCDMQVHAGQRIFLTFFVPHSAPALAPFARLRALSSSNRARCQRLGRFRHIPFTLGKRRERLRGRGAMAQERHGGYREGGEGVWGPGA